MDKLEQKLQEARQNPELQEALLKATKFIMGSIEDDFHPLTVKYFYDWSVKTEGAIGYYYGIVQLSNDRAYYFSVDTKTAIANLSRIVDTGSGLSTPPQWYELLAKS